MAQEALNAEMGNVFDRYNDFRHGIPLNPELAAVQQGKVSFHEPAQVSNEQPIHATEVAGKTITRSMRVLLRELRQHEGWPVLILILEKRVDEIRKNAITMSQDNPLKNKDAIAERWAYLQLGERFVESIDPMVQQELVKLEQEEKVAR